MVSGGRPDGLPRITTLKGYVSLNRLAPITFNDPVWVIVPGHSPDTPYGPLDWPATHGNTIPTAGTEMVLGIADDGSVHVLKWTGAHT